MNPLALALLKHHIQLLKKNRGYGRPSILTTDYIIGRIEYVLKTGCQWSCLPMQGGGCWKTVYHYFSKWSKAHVFEHCYSDLLKVYAKRGLSKEVIADTTFVKSIWGRDCVGKSPVDRGRNATKVSVLVDAKGTPLHILFHPGNKNDSRSLPHLLDNVSRRISIKGKDIYADRIYDSSYCSDAVKRHDMNNKISKKRAKPDKVNNRTRIVVEHCFSWFDKYRRIILRYDGLICHFRSFHFLAATCIVSPRCLSSWWS